MLFSNYSVREKNILVKLNSPAKIQDFLNGIKFNFEKRGDTCMSPRFVIKNKTAHCMEGAMFAAAALEYLGHKPFVLDLRSINKDLDHVVAPFKQYGCWGAISKTNHAVLRYREPVYKTIRELAMSYFHEYFLNSGRKTLREHSRPFDLRYFDKADKSARYKDKMTLINWRTTEKNLFAIPEHLDSIKHYKILSFAQIKNLRRADKIEIQAGKIMEWEK